MKITSVNTMMGLSKDKASEYLSDIYHLSWRLIPLLMLMLLPKPGLAQIFSPQADTAIKIFYNTYAGNDSVFVFYSPDNSPRTGSLTALPPSPGLYNFEWSKYNPSLPGFASSFYTETSVSQSVITNLADGGYRVRVTGPGVDTVFHAWVFVNDLRVLIEKDAQGKIKTGKYTCDFLIINGQVSAESFVYYDLNSNQVLSVPNGYRFLWTSDNPDLNIPNAATLLNPNITYLPPYINTRYFLTAADSFGMVDVDTVLYESIHVKSEFSFQFFDKADTKTFIDVSIPYEGGAPLTVKFINESINGNRFEWIFSDSTEYGNFQNEFTSSVDYEPEFSYLVPGDYYPALVATSMQGCIDTFKLEEPIVVLPSLLEVPNVFSPDGDDINEYFKVEHLSIREFTIVIINRWGKAVYKADVKDIYEWEGWDGTVLNTNNPAPPGAYFYIIEARGYDSKKYSRNQYKGTVYLFRAEDR
jgi:gliding motility-associated-like protein